MILELIVFLPVIAALAILVSGLADRWRSGTMGHRRLLACRVILALLGIIGLVQVGFVALFLHFRQRSKRLEEHRESLHLIEEGCPE